VLGFGLALLRFCPLVPFLVFVTARVAVRGSFAALSKIFTAASLHSRAVQAGGFKYGDDSRHGALA